ncbi:SDR family oxidoreductase [Roseomonas sp. SSH11]|uniref:SDR family oxidoreductase n=1 Tax=Pararoseomonas baculiformis TaxID=2820812 RepID=A0ABS4AGY8_9PROT|nr:SDR family oxidoreductase [Pararoseomonas baculiformis]MBP0446302.1 SDR family oxidoreductase [Pararoseomonas baculiformis]
MDPKNDAPSSRRQIMGSAALGAAALATTAAPAAAQNAAAPSSGQPAPLVAPRDPQNAYPRPPFPRQQQEWPGLASEMDPRPDHGETSYRGSGRLAGRKALVTGGDSGIGRAAAIAFAREGADVAIGYLPQEQRDAEQVLDLIRKEGRKAIALPGDIRDEAFCRRMVDAAVGELGGLDILVNNAARQHTLPSIEELNTELFDWTFKTNVYAPFWITKAALPHLKPGASIIITASVQAYEPSASLFDYAQTKACNVIFAKSLAKQLAPKGIRVNAVAPGPYWTPLQPSGGQEPEKLPEFGAESPMGRPGQPVELAGTYVLLASQESSYTTGQVLGASGGSGFP